MFVRIASKGVSANNSCKDVSVANASKDEAVTIAFKCVSVKNACTGVLKRNATSDVSVRITRKCVRVCVCVRNDVTS